MLKIWGRMTSINVRKVVLAAQELALPFQRTEAGGLFGVVKTPDYLAQNPNALVPVIEDEDFVLWESNVIVRYLCAKHSPGTALPDDLRERFDAERWMDWQQTTLNPAGRPAFLQLVRTPPEQRNAERDRGSNAAIEPLMAVLDAHLARAASWSATRFTMADIPIACEIHRWLRPAAAARRRGRTSSAGTAASRAHASGARCAGPAPVLNRCTTPCHDNPAAFKQVDVFTATPYLGNPLAVVLDGSGLSDEQMQRFARWTNLSETTFLLPPTDAAADYRVRIFTPGGELPFAGHPTLGSCHAWLEAGGEPQGDATFIVQECEVGLVRLRRDGGRGWPLPRRRSSAARPAAAGAGAGGRGAGPEGAAHPCRAGAATTARSGCGAAAGQRRTPCWRSSPTILRSSKACSGAARSAWPRVHAAAGEPDAAPRGARLRGAHRHRRRPGHRQPQRQPGAMADRRGPRARALRRGAGHGAWTAPAACTSSAMPTSGQVWVGGESVTCIAGTVTL